MVRESKTIQAREFDSARARRAEITRDIARNIKSMNETTLATREYIADCRHWLRKVDRLLQRE